MKEILFNIALIHSVEYCRKHGIDCSGTHLFKYPRQFRYALIRDSDGLAIITTTFYKHSVPYTSVNPQIKAKH